MSSSLSYALISKLHRAAGDRWKSATTAVNNNGHDYIKNIKCCWWKRSAMSFLLTGDERETEAGCRSEPQAAERQRVLGINACLQLVDPLREKCPTSDDTMCRSGNNVCLSKITRQYTPAL